MKKCKIVCAAVRLQDATIIPSVRHYDTLMRNLLKQLEPQYGRAVWRAEQGFLDNAGRFLDRKTAYKVAIEANQIPECEIRDLFSEDLY